MHELKDGVNMSDQSKKSSKIYSVSDKELSKVLKTVSKKVAKALADSDRIHKARLQKIHAFHAVE